MIKWKLQIRNKIEYSNIGGPVKSLWESGDEKIGELAKQVSFRVFSQTLLTCLQLLEYWSTLELSYKIPRVSKIASVRLSRP